MIGSVALRGAKAPVGFRRAAMAKAPKTRGARVAANMSSTPAFDSDWLNKTPLAAVLGFVGWTVPSSIPVGAFDGNSLFGLLNAQIGAELSHFPTGPSLDSPFWLYLVTWHVGLFTTMLLGQVGYNGRKQGYW